MDPAFAGMTGVARAKRRDSQIPISYSTVIGAWSENRSVL
jgi:hypothetical protein